MTSLLKVEWPQLPSRPMAYHELRWSPYPLPRHASHRRGQSDRQGAKGYRWRTMNSPGVHTPFSATLAHRCGQSGRQRRQGLMTMMLSRPMAYHELRWSPYPYCATLATDRWTKWPARCQGLPMADHDPPWSPYPFPRHASTPMWAKWLAKAPRVWVGGRKRNRLASPPMWAERRPHDPISDQRTFRQPDAPIEPARAKMATDASLYIYIHIYIP